MGLTIILGILLGLALLFGGNKPHSVKYTIGDFIGALLGGCIMAVMITFIFTTITAEILGKDDAYYVVTDRQIEELQEIEPGVYLTSAVETGYRTARFNMIVVKVNDRTRKVLLEDSKITLNSSEHMLETRKYDFANRILQWLLFNPAKEEYDIYTPQSGINGDFIIQ